MKELEEIWGEIPDQSLAEEDIDFIIGKKSHSELDKFKRVLSIELYVSLGLTLVLVLMHESVGMGMKVMTGGMVMIGSLINLVTLKSLNKIELLGDVKGFISKTLRILKRFLFGYLLTIQIVGIFVFTVIKALRSDAVPWKEWLLSDEGMLLLALYFVIEMALITYAWLFYYKRIESLKKLQKEL